MVWYHEQIENNCNDIVVNDITIPVEVKEEVYDNVDVINNDHTNNDDPERLKRLITNMEVKILITAFVLDMWGSSGIKIMPAQTLEITGIEMDFINTFSK